MQAPQIVLDKGLIALHPYQQSAGRDCETLAWLNHKMWTGFLRPQNYPLKTHLFYVTPTPTRPKLLIVPIPMGS